MRVNTPTSADSSSSSPYRTDQPDDLASITGIAA
jgi:hypothetical protein